MKIVKKSLTLLLALAMTLSLASCGKETEQEPTVEETPVTTRVAALKGPTAMGMVKLMSDNEATAEEGGEEDAAQGGYEFTLAASADEVTPSLMKGDLDIACVPANLASVLYNKTGGDIVTLAINTLGVLYVVENGNAVQSMADLTGKTIVASGKGSTPEYALRYLLTENGLNPDADVVVDWKSEHSECVAALASGAATVALLPQPFVTVAQSKMPDLRVALDLTEEWDKTQPENGSSLVTGVTVCRKEVLEQNPEAAELFVKEHGESAEWVNANVTDAAELVAAAGIIEKAPIAAKAIPYCSIVCIDGKDMKTRLSGYLEALYEMDPSAVGGQMPDDGFYYLHE